MKINQYGRSMVEMLGVLAIVGVLSIIGIVGYKIAMRRYQANEIANTVATLMVMAHAASAGEGGCIQLSTSNLPKYPGGVDLDIVADQVGDKVSVWIKLAVGEDDAICDAVDDLFSDDDIECNSDWLPCSGSEFE